jgi:hypothetical protein
LENVCHSTICGLLSAETLERFRVRRPIGSVAITPAGVTMNIDW